MKKIFLLFFLFCSISMSAKVIYLVPNAWESDNPALFVHSWGGGADKTGKMEKLSDNLYSFDIGNNTKCLFVRQNAALGDNISWDQKWNQTGDLIIPADKNCYTITGWGANDGSWSVYSTTPTVSLAGDMNVWNTSATPFVLSADEKTATVSVSLQARSYVFKIVVNNEWLGHKGTITRANCSGILMEKGDGSDAYNCTLTADAAGEYVFTYTLADKKLSVAYPQEDSPTTPDTPVTGRVLYLYTGGSSLWNQANAKFFVHSWGADGHADVQMTLHEGDVYKVSVPEEHTSIIFLRQAPTTTSVEWDAANGMWNKTADLAIPATKDCYAIRGWGESVGTWIVLGAEPFPTPLYGTSVPGNCPDVMLQAFYWDSNQDKFYGNTRWQTLNAKAQELTSYFDLIWLPPSAHSSGGVGYIPKQYSNQNCDWGTRSELEQLIQSFHDGGAKVVADMVVNHIDGKDGWCSFYEQDFGKYGKYQVDGSYICKGDEMNWDADEYCRGKATGPDDDGYDGSANYGAARDLAHDSETVREMIRAYARWMIDEMKYDGFRYDYCKGFHMSHVDDYNANSGAYFSVLEYWDGNADVLWSRIADAKENTLAFDFGVKYDALNDGIAYFNYAKCKAPGLLGKGKGKWAVTFVDNHDTFEREHSEFGGNFNSMSNDMRDRLLQANAFILSMPGVPCVFYPHWVKYSAEIGPMILARKAVGVHSESQVSDEVIGNGYRAVVTGTKGSLILELGDACSNVSWGYTEVASGPGYKMYITYEASAPMLTVHTPSTTYRTSNMTIKISAVGFGGTPTIYYTLDGTDPKTSTNKLIYDGEITISGSVTLKAYAELNDKQSDVQTYTYTYVAPQKEPITISFLKPDAWSVAYLYTWTADNQYPTGTWPGMQLYQKNAGGYFYHKLERTDAREINFILHNNEGVQSQNLLTYEDVCYGWEEDRAVVASCYAGGDVTTHVENTTHNSTSSLDPTQPMYNVLGQRVDAHYRGVVIQNGRKFVFTHE